MKLNTDMLETATKYILDLLTNNEELKKFPKEFVDEAVLWVKSWFLKPEEPRTNAKLEDPNKSIDVKKDIIEDKLEELKDNSQFQEQLAERLAAFQQQRARLKNVLTDATINAKGNVHIGDKGAAAGENYDEKNVIKGGSITSGGDFRLGDDLFSGNENVQIVHNYYSGGKTSEKAKATYTSIKAELQALVKQEKTGEAIDRFLEIAEQHGLDVHNELLLLYARFTRISKNERQSLLSTAEVNIERNRINAALTALIEEMKM